MKARIDRHTNTVTGSAYYTVSYTTNRRESRWKVASDHVEDHARVPKRFGSEGEARECMGDILGRKVETVAEESARGVPETRRSMA